MYFHLNHRRSCAEVRVFKDMLLLIISIPTTTTTAIFHRPLHPLPKSKSLRRKGSAANVTNSQGKTIVQSEHESHKSTPIAANPSLAILSRIGSQHSPGLGGLGSRTQKPRLL